MLTKGKIVPNLPSELFEIGQVRQSHVRHDLSADFKMVFLSLFRGSVNDKLS